MKKSLFLFTLAIITFDSLSQNFLWAKNIGSTNYSNPNGNIVDVSGNVYIVGSFAGIADFDPGPGVYNMTSVGSADIFILKLDAFGNFIWARSVASIGNEQAISITVDDYGNSYTTNIFEGTVDFDPGVGISNLISKGDFDISILKLDSTGRFLWAKSMGGNSLDFPCHITSDHRGNIYSTGRFTGTADFDPGSAPFNLIGAGKTDIFISKLDSGGNFLWAKSIGDTSDENGYSIAVDDSGNVYSTGTFTGTIDFDPGSGNFNLIAKSNIAPSAYVLKLNTAGNFIWAKNFSGTAIPSDISVDSMGNIYTTGVFVQTVDFDPGAGVYNLICSGVGDVYVSKLDASGNFAWAARYGNSAIYEQGRSIAVDRIGNVYTCTYGNGTIDMDPGPGVYNLTSNSSFDIFISKLNSSGNFVAAYVFGGKDAESPGWLRLDASGDLYLCGNFKGICDFDPGSGVYNIASTGSNNDLFVSKLGNCNMMISKEPSNQILNQGHFAFFTTASSDSLSKYQWQQNSGTGFYNITNNFQFAGATDDTLVIKGVTVLQNNNEFRCITTSGICSATTYTVSLKINNTIGMESFKSENFIVFPNPTTTFLSIQTKNVNQETTYTIIDKAGRQLLYGKLNNESTSIDLSGISAGFYFLQIGEFDMVTYKLIKE